jgi:hypothetical protein
MWTLPVKGQRPSKDCLIDQINALSRQSVKWKNYGFATLLFAPNLTKAPFCLHVGESANSPDVRFGKYRSSHTTPNAVRRCGTGLLPSLCKHIAPFSKSERAIEEKALWSPFNVAGFWVEGGR